MRKFSLGGAAGLLVAVAFSAHAKPPDLPVKCHDKVVPAVAKPAAGVGVNANGGVVGSIIQTAQTWQENSTYEVPPPDPLLPLPLGMPRYEDGGVFSDGDGFHCMCDSARDSDGGCPCCRALCRRFWQALCSLFSDDHAPAAAAPAASSQDAADATPDTAESVANLLVARRLYRIGQRCQGKGNLDLAYSCFQEVHLLAPTSRYGRQAIEGMSQIEQLQAARAALEQKAKNKKADEDDAAAGRKVSARHLYHVGERCEQRRDYGMAINCFREVQLLCPGSVYARRAARHVADIEAQQSADEAAEPAEEERSPDQPQDNVRCPGQSCPAGKQSGAKSSPGKPRLEIIEQQSTPPGNKVPQDDISARTLRLPLYVNPAARRLVIQQDYPEGADE